MNRHKSGQTYNRQQLPLTSGTRKSGNHVRPQAISLHASDPTI
jgi:hypothetical protein